MKYITLDRLESWASNWPHLLGLPVLDGAQDESNPCNTSFKFSLSIFVCSSFILLMPASDAHVFMDLFSYNPQGPMFGKVLGSLTANFVHGNLSHLLFNLYFFLIFSKLVERKYGAQNLLIAFIFCSIVSNYGSVLFRVDAHSIGVSGTLSGFMGLIAVTQPNLKFRILKILLLPWWFIALLLFVMPDLASEFHSARSGQSDHINQLAHLFGFLSGYILSLLLLPVSENKIPEKDHL